MKNLEMKEMSFEEVIYVSGGHKSTAYEAGRTAMKILKAAAMFLAFRRI